MRFFLPCLLVLLTSQSQGQGTNPFDPHRVAVQYAPDRTCHLEHLRVDLNVDYAGKRYWGRSENTLIPLRDGITTVGLMAGPMLRIDRVTVDGRETTFERKGRNLLIKTSPLVRGKKIVVAIDYETFEGKAGSGAMHKNGFHWILPRPGIPNREGFWTEGFPNFNSDWAPTWDYPNDFATTETHVTVPADWTVIGNGLLKSNTLSQTGKTRTFVWRLDIPHVTWLTTLVGGPLDVHTDQWRGVQLMYAAPKGMGKYLDYTFEGTKVMLSFFSDTLGFKYPWPKYAQNVMFDFDGGMETVSATSLYLGTLTRPQDGIRQSDSIVSHEMAHQWFGDTVTCRDWGESWLNEGITTYMQMLYFEHSRGKQVYDSEVVSNTQRYLSEAKRYKRPISTKVYEDPASVFDAHDYDKAAVVLHSLRRQLGDSAFFAGLKLYLHRNQHSNVDSHQLCAALSEASGINCEPFFEQWIFKPGHPVLDYTWAPNPLGKGITLHVKQVQSTDDGTPIYKIPAKVVVISNGKLSRFPVNLGTTDDSFSIPTEGIPDAVILDGDHDFLRDIPTVHWSHRELTAIANYAPVSADRAEAMRLLLNSSPSAEDVRLVQDLIRADGGKFPTISLTPILRGLNREDLWPFLESMLGVPSVERRTQAINLISGYSATPERTARLRGLINDREAASVVVASIQTLSHWDAKANQDVFKKALEFDDPTGIIHSTAQAAIGQAGR